jgi:hypothetical protein
MACPQIQLSFERSCYILNTSIEFKAIWLTTCEQKARPTVELPLAAPCGNTRREGALAFEDVLECFLFTEFIATTWRILAMYPELTRAAKKLAASRGQLSSPPPAAV